MSSRDEQQTGSAQDRVAIIGAGGSGLAAAQALAVRAVPFTVFEAGSGLGGNWRFDNDSGLGSAYASLHTNISRQGMSFRCFPLEHGPTFPHHSDMLAYLEAFADHFELRRHIRFSTPVRAARRVAGGWEVTTDQCSERFRALVVAVGYCSVPKLPEFPGSIDGPVLHTHDYRTPEPFADRDVVVVGMGCSAAELACEIRGVARSVTIAAHSSSWVFPRRVGPLPIDRVDTRAGSRLPFSVRRRLATPLVRAAGGSQVRAGLPAPGHRFGERPTCTSDTLISMVRRKEIAVAPAAVELLGDRVRLADGAERPATALLLGTGYQTSFPFLTTEYDPPTTDRAPLYRGVVSQAAPDLYYVGLVYALGGLIPTAEAQSNWIGEILAGHLELPSGEVMRASVDRDAERRRRNFDPRLDIFWDRLPYIRALEAETRRARRHVGVSKRAALATA